MTLMEKARSMLSGVGLGHKFWVEAVGTTCYLVNRSPSSVLVDKTPHEEWTSKISSLEHLKVVVIFMYVFQRKIGVSWITKLKNVYLLVIKMVQ